MPFRVLLTPEAELETTEILTNAVDRNAIMADFRDVSHRLRKQPLEVGESRESEFQRVMFVGSLLASYLVDQATNTVFVFRVRKRPE